MNVCKHFMIDCRNKVFEDHEHNNVYEESRQSTLVKLIAERYFKLRLFSYGKRYDEAVDKGGKSSGRHKLTKLILFKNE